MARLNRGAVQRHMATLVGAAMLAIAPGLAAGQTAADSGAGELVGDWGGVYFCNQGLTGMTLRILEDAPEVRALYAFYPIQENPELPFGCYEMNGSFDAETRELYLQGGRWLRQPEGWITVDLRGTVDFEANTLIGDVDGLSCTFFDLERTPPSPRVDESCQPDVFASLPPSSPAASGLPQ